MDIGRVGALRCGIVSFVHWLLRLNSCGSPHSPGASICEMAPFLALSFVPMNRDHSFRCDLRVFHSLFPFDIFDDKSDPKKSSGNQIVGNGIVFIPLFFARLDALFQFFGIDHHRSARRLCGEVRGIETVVFFPAENPTIRALRFALGGLVWMVF